uniref:Uncharacterized protein n=1 Tax=Anguilla anguilla TaxID=7936 RepID=A0A0E9P6B2_ANGAN
MTITAVKWESLCFRLRWVQR